jgi:streptogrisin C
MLHEWRRPRSQARALCLAVICGLLGSAPVSAEHAGFGTNLDASSPVEVITPEAAQLADAEAYAQAVGVAPAEALARIEKLPALAAVLSRVEGLTASRFAGGWIEHEPDLRLVMRFTGTGTLPVAASDTIARLGVGSDVVLDAEHTLVALQEGQENITTTIYREHPDTGMYVDVRTGSVRLIGPDSIGAIELEALSKAAGVPVTAEVMGPAKPHHTYGGHRIDAVLLCTTGFSTKDAVSGLTGVLTAGHCAGGAGSQATYHDTAGFPPYSGTMSGKRWDANQDFAWYQTPHDEYPIFFDGQHYRDVIGVRPRIEMVGNLVCHYGRTTGRSCGFVDTIRYDPGFNYCNGGPCSDRWVGIFSDWGMKCSDGDSGGPYYFGNAAWGIHSGGWWTGEGYGQCPIAIMMSAEQLTWDGVNTRIMLAGSVIAMAGD